MMLVRDLIHLLQTRCEPNNRVMIRSFKEGELLKEGEEVKTFHAYLDLSWDDVEQVDDDLAVINLPADMAIESNWQ